MMSAKEMLEEVQRLKGSILLTGFKKNQAIDRFFEENWVQILDILEDALYEYVNERGER